MPTLLGFFSGPLELGIIALIVLLLFGSRLPSTMRSLGRGMIEFKKGLQGIDDDDATDKSGVVGKSVAAKEESR